MNNAEINPNRAYELVPWLALEPEFPWHHIITSGASIKSNLVRDIVYYLEITHHPCVFKDLAFCSFPLWVVFFHLPHSNTKRLTQLLSLTKAVLHCFFVACNRMDPLVRVWDWRKRVGVCLWILSRVTPTQCVFLICVISLFFQRCFVWELHIQFDCSRLLARH